MIQICITSRLSSLPVVVAYKKGYFEEFGVKVTLHVNTHHKAIMSLLDAGRVEAGEVPTIAYLQDSFLKKSKLKRIYKGIYLYHSPLSFYSRFQFKPEDLTRNKAYILPVPHQYSVERLFAEKFLEEYAPKNPVKVRYTDTPGFLEEKEFLKPSCLGLVSDPFSSPFLRNFQDFAGTLELPILEAKSFYPSTLLAFSGDAILKTGREVSAVLLAVKKAIDFLQNTNQNTGNLWEDLQLSHFYPHLRVGETKNLLNAHPLIQKGVFSYSGDATTLFPLLKDVYFRLIRRVMQPEAVKSALDFEEILSALAPKKVFDVRKLNSFQEPAESKLHAPSQINYRKLNAVRHLIVDVNSVVLDILQGNYNSRLNSDETLQLDNRVKVLVNSMLDSFNAKLELQREEITELENLISILEIKLDRSAVDLQYSEEKYRYLFEFSREAIALVDADTGSILEANNQFRSLTGYTRGDITKMNIEDIILGNQVSNQLRFGSDLSSDTMLSLPDSEILLKDGSKLEVDISFTSILLSPKKRYQVQFRPNSEKKEQERLQHEFISNVSHELRSPMTNIRGYLEFFKSDTSLPFNTEHKNMLEVIDKNAKRLSFLIENLLKLTTSREKDKEAEVIEIFDPVPVIEDVIHMNSHLAKGKPIEWNLALKKGFFLRGIKFEFSQIITNLYVNALKYTAKGKIGISIRETNGKIEITVEDTGLGIDPNYKNQIFDRFFRIPSSDNKKIGGTGLGLSIVKSLVDKMSGEIFVESKMGLGSKFTIYFPKVNINV
ncbi:PAS domain-containing sensor histidine kinase [Leptospira brenneri]|uniref:histidine kinase n=1 Tax=Leptospira brenneri TaxID=2023182 RepID=A0A2M9XYE2_9LEPT|nr:PAS domain-containing sensor histidine kinase [Leptospira brenneri]PJZ44196.1 PAS domain-containing sensor histidine kinase [Leptospira brenneri]TGK92864.1 PAS domain S-box protein [Leptospira brenneri]